MRWLFGCHPKWTTYCSRRIAPPIYLLERLLRCLRRPSPAAPSLSPKSAHENEVCLWSTPSSSLCRKSHSELLQNRPPSPDCAHFVGCVHCRENSSVMTKLCVVSVLVYGKKLEAARSCYTQTGQRYRIDFRRSRSESQSKVAWPEA